MVWRSLHTATSRTAFPTSNFKDIVFFYHRGVGVIAAGEVLNGPVKYEGEDEAYRDVKFLTKVPRREHGSIKMSSAEVERVTQRSFFWAKTVKVPYLQQEESKKLLEALLEALR